MLRCDLLNHDEIAARDVSLRAETIFQKHLISNGLLLDQNVPRRSLGSHHKFMAVGFSVDTE
jgi:hypothetical protein